MKIITMLGGPYDGQVYEVKSIGDMNGYIIIFLDNLRDPMNSSPKGTIKTAHVPIKMTSKGSYYADWEARLLNG